MNNGYPVMSWHKGTSTYFLI